MLISVKRKVSVAELKSLDEVVGCGLFEVRAGPGSDREASRSGVLQVHLGLRFSG